MSSFSLKGIEAYNLDGLRVLMREDFNVPMEHGEIRSASRIEAALPSIQAVLNAGVKQLILVSHLGRPTEGVYSAEDSLAPVAVRLSELLQRPVPLVRLGQPLPSDTVVLLENIRCEVGEQDNAPALAQKLAALCDIFVMDAFACAHRAQASTVGVAAFAPQACAGPLLLQEIHALSPIFEHPKRPIMAIIGGSKVSTKIKLIQQLITKVDYLVIGGGMANTFLAAQGYSVGISRIEADWLAPAKEMLADAAKHGCTIVLPEDVVVATKMTADAETRVCGLDEVGVQEGIFDIGPKSIASLSARIREAACILWNGPVGVFELAPFAAGTHALALAIQASPAYKVAGGGDTVSAIEQFGVRSGISYLSTGGGAFLEYLEALTLPAIEALKEKQAV
ncbi:MAG: phosphoglycerate kinase [Pseudomonadota bacterium]